MDDAGWMFCITWWLRPCALADYCVWFVASRCVAVKIRGRGGVEWGFW